MILRRSLIRSVMLIPALIPSGEFLKNASLKAARFSGQAEWTEPFPAHQVIGNVYYVGSRGLASYLIVTPQSLILINSSLESSVPMIRESIGKLGFRFEDVRILLISHAHFDHCAGSALVKQLTHAKYMVMDADAPEVEAGGRGNFQYGNQPDMLYKATRVDRVLKDGDEVQLGGAVLVAHLTAGHTKGCTTWTIRVNEKGKAYDVVIVGSTNVNPGYQLIHNARYPQIARDFERTFQTLKSLPCDVFLGAHGGYYDMETKFARLGKEAANPFIDPAGYQAFLQTSERAFQTEKLRQAEGRR